MRSNKNLLVDGVAQHFAIIFPTIESFLFATKRDNNDVMSGLF